jgi:hypothetical protein
MIKCLDLIIVYENDVTKVKHVIIDNRVVIENGQIVY